jgi:leucyl-tRNA synthetase
MDYQFKEIEQKWQQFWAQNQTFKAEDKSSKPKYYVLDMFPYPSGAGLHVGHPLGYIASDIFARYKRLKGFNVLHPMGYDSFGLPAEQYAIQTGQHPAITTEDNIATYRRQLDQIGFSFDWSREVRTSSPDYYKWTQWIFMQLFNSWYNKDADKAQSIAKLVAHFESNGSAGINAASDEEILSFTADEWKALSNQEQQAELLKYRLTYLRESTVNWCPALGTVLANDEVKDGFSERGGYPVEQKKMTQWSMRITAYAERLLQGLNTIDWPEPLKEMQRNWIGKSTGASVKFSLTPTLSKGEGAKRQGFETADITLWEALKENSKANRQNPTEAEAILWELFRNSNTGHKIRRQHAIDGYIADFVCLGKGLVIEVDGGYHDFTKEQDELRTFVLNSEGFDVIRFTNDEVIRNPQIVVQKVKEKLDNQSDRKVLSFGEDLGEASFIEVFTTRVDTIFGVTFLVIAPEHELVSALTTAEQKADIEAYIAQTKKKSELDRMADAKTVSGAFTGSYVLNPLNGQPIPIWIADYVLAGYGTGAVMAVPSGDQRDYLFAKHFNLPIVPIIDIQNIETEADPTKEGTYINSDFMNGLTYKDATAAVVTKLEEINAGKAKINFRMRDAIFGRQRYWGEPVPVYFKDGLPYLIDESHLPLLLPEVDKYLPTETGEPPLGRATNWHHPEGEYELSTMPGWAGSSWYWYRYMDAQNDKEFASREAIEYWKDVDLYIGGSEHATGHLLYSRFWNKFLKDLDLVVEEEPFKKLINQGMIQGMSEKACIRIGVFNNEDGTRTLNQFSSELIEYNIEPFQNVNRWFVSSDLIDKKAIELSYSLLNVPVKYVENSKLNIEKYGFLPTTNGIIQMES